MGLVTWLIKKKVDAISKNDISKKREKFEEIVQNVLKSHDQLLKIGFEGLAGDALKIHDNLLGVKEETVEQDNDRPAKET